MLPQTTIARATKDALDYIRSQDDVEDAEVFVSANRILLTRLNYTSHIPCNGLEEPKSTENFGIGVQAVFKATAEKELHRVGFGSEPSDISVEGVKTALGKARTGAVEDPEFRSLPRPTGERRQLHRYSDPRLIDIDDASLIGAGWSVVDGALRIFQSSKDLCDLTGDPDALRQLGLIVSGDITILQERMAIGSLALPEIQSDESTIIMSFITAMVEREGAKGSGYSAAASLRDFNGDAGTQAATSAVGTIDGVRVADGEYRVILGQQAVMDILVNLILPSLSSEAFYMASSPFMGKWGQQISSPKFNLVDDGVTAGLAGSKGITCEGLATGRTQLIKQGQLVGLLSNYYGTQRLIHDPHAKEKLGTNPKQVADGIVPRNGFRYARGGGRHFDSPASIHATNVIVPGDVPSREELIKYVRDGLYIGRIWYTYPVNGLRAGDFTCTVVGDSYIIQDGKLAKPIRPNTIRINDNIRNLLAGIAGVTKDSRPTIVWAADEIVYAPEIAVDQLRVQAIAEYMETI